ncbi:MAG: hypothetical protein H6Q19_1873 [Bacteroidetes bacterium]|nr:hypothetical protein [Bacteroidota bacterium]
MKLFFSQRLRYKHLQLPFFELFRNLSKTELPEKTIFFLFYEKFC